MVGVLAAELPAMIGVLMALPSSAKFPELVSVVVTPLSSSAKLSALDRMLILALPSSVKFSAPDSASSSGDADELNTLLDMVTQYHLPKNTCHALVKVFLPWAIVHFGHFS